jgi:predicted Zn-dependent protease
VDQAQRLQAEKEYAKAVKELCNGKTLSALASLEIAIRNFDNPEWHSMLGFCIAKERGHVTKGLELCKKSIERAPENPDHYYFLGKLYLVAKNKTEAFNILRQGMLATNNHPIIQNLLVELGPRKQPVIPWLDRNHQLNKYLGIFFTKIGLR